MRCVSVTDLSDTPTTPTNLCCEEEQTPNHHLLPPGKDNTSVISRIARRMKFEGISLKIDWIHVALFVILFFNILCLKRAVFLVMEEGAPTHVASFEVMDGAAARTRVDVFTRGFLCWEAMNNSENKATETLSLTTSAAGRECTTVTSPAAQQGPSASLIRYTTVILAVWLGYNILPLVQLVQREFGNKIMCRLTTFSAFCALLALAGNLKVLHNASQQAARLTFRHQDGNGANYLPEIAPQPVSTAHPQLVPFGLSVVLIMLSTVVLILSIFVAWRAATTSSCSPKDTPNTTASDRTKKALLGKALLFFMCTWMTVLPFVCL